jgi:CheY-like chemotaxis protein
MAPRETRTKWKTLILCADDDDDDRLLIKEAFESAEIPSALSFVENGQDLLDYLRHSGKYSGSSIPSPRPDLVLLDLNMPHKDGREVLREIKSDSRLCGIPIIVLTTSNEREDVRRCYALGANRFICKPQTYAELQIIVAFIGCELLSYRNKNNL